MNFLKRYNSPLFVFLISLFEVYLLDIFFFQKFISSKKEILFCLIIFFISLFINYILIKRVLIPLFQQNPRKKAIFLGSVIFTILVTYLFAGIFYDQHILPKHYLKVEVLSETNPNSSGRDVYLRNMETEIRNISFNEFNSSSGWKRVEKSTLASSSTGEIFEWSGRTGSYARLRFLTGLHSGMIKITWDNQPQTVDLYSNTTDEITIDQPFKIPPASYLVPLLAVGVLSFYIFLLIGVLIFPFTSRDRSPSNWYWLLFSLPMFLTWSFYLLVFWPGEMSSTSIIQWGQVVSGSYNNFHPAVHSFLIWLITRLWFSPAAVALFQIICLSLVTAWGIGILVDHGMNLPAGWFISILFAISPINSTLVMSIWKDIPYSTAFLLFSLQILKVIFSRGRWLEKWPNCLGLGLSGLSIMLLRHNGLPVPILSLLVVVLFYKKYWLRIVVTLGTLIISCVLILGPIYDALGVNKNSGVEDNVFIHHIAAHIIDGNPLTTDEENLANLILPLDKWKYDCCSNVITHQVPNFSYGKVAEYSSEVRRLFIKLAIKEPGIELKHIACVSQLVWKSYGSCGFWVSNIISENRLIAENPYGIREDSQFPQVKKWLLTQYDFLYRTVKFRFYWYPIYYLILVVLGSFSLMYWYGEKKSLLFTVPSVFQSLILALVNVSAFDFRYQYGVYLVGLFSLGLIILSINKHFQLGLPEEESKPYNQ
jgi:hypothetical protein